MKLLVDIAYKSEKDGNLVYVNGETLKYDSLFRMIDWYITKTNINRHLEVLSVDILEDMCPNVEIELNAVALSKSGKSCVIHLEDFEICDIIEQYKTEVVGYLHYEVLKLNFVI